MPLGGHASGASVIGVTVAFTVVAALTVGLRLWARLAVSRNAGWDDVLIGFALVFTIATTTTMIIQVENGMSRHADTITPSERMVMLKAFYISIWVYNLSLSSTKLSILLQYLRIFPQRRFRLACHILLALVVIYTCYTFFTAIFACSPIAYFWDDTIEGGKCLNRFAIWFANSGINIGTDVLTAVLPLPMLRGLELPRRQRRALMIVFGLGGFTCIVSILRLQSLYVISQSTDVPWDNPLAAIWSSVEANTAIICSCLPTLRCIFPRLLRSQLSLSGLSRSENTTNTTPNMKLFPTMKSKIVSSVEATGEEVEMEGGKKCGSSEGKKCGGRSSHCKRGGKRCSDPDTIELEIERTPFPRGIQVTTAIEQALTVERDDSSTRELVRGKDDFDSVSPV